MKNWKIFLVVLALSLFSYIVPAFIIVTLMTILCYTIYLLVAEKSFKLKIFMLLLMPLAMGIVIIKENSKKQAEQVIKDAEDNRVYEAKRKSQQVRKQALAQNFKTFLRNNGVNESLVLDVQTHPDLNSIVIVVSNDWLLTNKQIQKQNKQVFEMALKHLNPPDGWPFMISDHMGNPL